MYLSFMGTKVTMNLQNVNLDDLKTGQYLVSTSFLSKALKFFIKTEKWIICSQETNTFQTKKNNSLCTVIQVNTTQEYALKIKW